ncbi:hypothetical protein [Nocardioides pacificus]
MRLALGTLALALVGSFAPAAAVSPPSAPAADAVRAVAPQERAAAPSLQVRRVVGGLEIPWDVQVVDGGGLLITERETKRLLLHRAARPPRWPSPATRSGPPARPG